MEGGRLRVVRGATPSIEGAEVVDASGLTVAPGIVDLHTHSDVSNLSEPHAISAIEQGVTTQVVGLCGFSAAPVRPDTLATMIAEEPVFGFPDVPWDWTTIGGYLETVNRVGVATNTVTLFGHNTLRRAVIGSDGRPPTPDELAQMQDLMRQAFDEGARGFSTGLTYAPGLFATTDELVSLASVAAERGKPYHTHMRVDRVPDRRRPSRRRSRRPNGPVPRSNISHLYPATIDPPDEADRIIGLIEAANAPWRADHLGRHGVPARRWRVGAVPAGLGARRADRRRQRRACATRPRAPDRGRDRGESAGSSGRAAGTTS